MVKWAGFKYFHITWVDMCNVCNMYNTEDGVGNSMSMLGHIL